MSEPSTDLISYRGVVYPAQCDAMGHMNVQYYTAVFDQAMWQLVLALGFAPSWVTDRREGWADVRYEIDFRRELRVGQLFYAESGVVRVGNASLTTLHRIREAESREIAAVAQITSVYFDLARRASRPLPAGIRSAAERATSKSAANDPDPRG